MSEPNLLAELKDIHVPEPIGFFPLAPGWWILLFGICLLLATAILLGYRRYRRNFHKRKALSLLSVYEKDYQTNQNPMKTCAFISELLKRVALVYFPRKQVASLSGLSWINFLNKTGKGIDFKEFQFHLTELIYQPSPPTPLPQAGEGSSGFPNPKAGEGSSGFPNPQAGERSSGFPNPQAGERSSGFPNPQAGRESIKKLFVVTRKWIMQRSEHV